MQLGAVRAAPALALAWVLVQKLSAARSRGQPRRDVPSALLLPGRAQGWRTQPLDIKGPHSRGCLSALTSATPLVLAGSFYLPDRGYNFARKAEVEPFSVTFVSLNKAQIFDFVFLPGIKLGLLGSICQLPTVIKERTHEMGVLALLLPQSHWFSTAEEGAQRGAML